MAGGDNRVLYALGIGAVVLFFLYQSSSSPRPAAAPSSSPESHAAQLAATARVASSNGRFKCPEVMPCDCSAEGASSASSNLLSAVASAAAAAAAEAAQCPSNGAPCPKCQACPVAAVTPAPAAAPEHPCVKASKSPFQFDTSCFAVDTGLVRIGRLSGPPHYRVSVPNSPAMPWLGVGGGGELNGGPDPFDYVKNYLKWVKDLPKDTVALDIGANLGLSLLPMASAGVWVVGFEPVAYNVLKLKQSVLINNYNKVAIVHAAVGHKPRKVTIYAPQDREDNTSLHPAVANANVGGALRQEEVDLVSVDSWLEANRDYVDSTKIRFIKIDVQGFEYDVIKGAEKLLRQQVKHGLTIEAEYSPTLITKGGGNPLEMLHFMDDIGYQIHGTSDPSLITKARFEEVSKRGGQDDFVFTPKP